MREDPGVRVLVAPDKLAGTLTAVEAAAAIAAGWSRALPRSVVDQVPLSDGGPGFVAVLRSALGGRLEPVDVTGPLAGAVQANLLVTEVGGVWTVYVEAAQACGLALVTPTPATALAAGTTGVGELLLAALRHGARRVVVGVGGTASTDGGRGCLEAVGPTGWPAEVELLVATDVTAPLLGPTGAARVFAAQKGADPAAVVRLEERLTAWAEESGRVGRAGQAGVDPDRPGAGAGGGLGYGLLLLGGRVVPGTDAVFEAVGLAGRVSTADLVVTAEGRLDASTLLGKAPLRVAALARELSRPCVVLAGDCTLGSRALEGTGVESVHTLVAAYGRPEALARPAARLADLAEQVARGWSERVPD